MTVGHLCPQCERPFRAPPWRKYCSRPCSDLGRGIIRFDALAGSKVCRACRATLSLEAFHRAPANADGHVGICKDCTRGERAPKGAFGRCEATRHDGQRCGNDATSQGRCAVHLGYGNRHARKRLAVYHRHVDSVRMLADAGCGAGAISQALDVGYEFIRGALTAAGCDPSVGNNSPVARQHAKKLWREQLKREEQERQRNRNKARQLVRQGGPLPWHLDQPQPLTSEQQAELDELVASQSKDGRFVYRPPTWVGLDEPVARGHSDESERVWELPAEVDEEDDLAYLIETNGVEASAHRSKRRHAKWAA